MVWLAHLSIHTYSTITEGASTLFYGVYIWHGPIVAQDYGRLNTTAGYVAYILDMWHI